MCAWRGYLTYPCHCKFSPPTMESRGHTQVASLAQEFSFYKDPSPRLAL